METTMEKFTLPHNHNHDQQDNAWIHKQLERSEDFQDVADVFKQLGDSTRLKIFWMLCHCEECVIDIAAMMDMSMPAVSHHLKQLKISGLIVSRREGKEVYYKAAESILSQQLHFIIERVMEITCTIK